LVEAIILPLLAGTQHCCVQISKLFYDGVIPDEQLEIAAETRKLINKKVGSYNDFRLALTHPEKLKPETD
jgi:hypothetical protein